MNKKHVVVLSGAGVSAESGLKTFRDNDGLWNGYDVYEVATPRGFAKNPKLVLEKSKRQKIITVVDIFDTQVSPGFFSK